ncbi:hypothetical protein DCAR_0208582 [Daucus carota subsp. sativus]|uniref:Uncharacterized protein n=1 Tax=Daucus carota subsp. sativus TaxID=79200 RepID=A0A166EMD9_DAUCS|nr:hypothetical protein DCAR_0208582 [Daucus carota subsp. sativus]
MTNSTSYSSSVLLTLFVLAILLSPALVVPSQAARFRVPETNKKRLVCTNCICCEPAPSRKCACCVCP